MKFWEACTARECMWCKRGGGKVSWGCCVRKEGSRQCRSLCGKWKHQSSEPCVVWPLPEEMWQFSKQSHPPCHPHTLWMWISPPWCMLVGEARWETLSLSHPIECFLRFLVFLRLEVVRLCAVRDWLVVCSQSFISWTALPLWPPRRFSKCGLKAIVQVWSAARGFAPCL